MTVENNPKTKKQKHQEKRLGRNVRQQQANKKAARNNSNANKHKASAVPVQKQSGAKNTLMQKMFGVKTAPQTAQQSIPYREMYKDGICRVKDRLYTKTITFGDINYQLAQNEDKTQIFEGYCDFLNYFDNTVTVQLSFINKYGNMKDFEKAISIPDQDDDFNRLLVSD